MKNIKSIGKDIFKKIYPEIVEFGFKDQTMVFDHTIDIHRRIENLYSNFSRDFKEKNSHLEPYVISLTFEIYGIELGKVILPLVVSVGNNDTLRKDLVDFICGCERIKQTGYAPTHLIAVITAEGKKWKRIHREIYYLEKWQSEEIVNKS